MSLAWFYNLSCGHTVIVWPDGRIGGKSPKCRTCTAWEAPKR